MHSSLLLALWAGGAFVIYKIVAYTLDELHHSRNAKRLGCEPAYNPSDTHHWGIPLTRRIIRVFGQKRVLPFIKQRFDDVQGKEGRFISTFHQNTLGTVAFFTADPKNIQSILATQFKNFGLEALRYDNIGALLGKGIFVTDGENWSHARALARPQFARNQVSDLDLEEHHVRNFLRRLPAASDGWTEVTDIRPLFFNLTIDSATNFLFGQSIDSQLVDLPGHDMTNEEGLPAGISAKRFGAAFDAALAAVSQAGFMGDFWWLMHGKELKENIRICHSFLDHHVQLALAKEKSTQGVTSAGKQKFVYLDGLMEETRDPITLRNQMTNILLAGRDSTASLLCFVFMVLSQRPDVYKKLRTIILETFGTYNQPRGITFEGLKDCSYLQWMLNETLRLYPLVPVNGRRALKDTMLPAGGGQDGTKPLYVRKGRDVNYSVYVMQRRKDLWGEDADVFRPERWDGRRPGWEYLPFNGGPRICIGQQFALTEAGYVVVRILQKFEECVGVGNSWDPVEKGGFGFERCALTLVMSPADGVKVRFKEAAA